MAEITKGKHLSLDERLKNGGFAHTDAKHIRRAFAPSPSVADVDRAFAALRSYRRTPRGWTKNMAAIEQQLYARKKLATAEDAKKEKALRELERARRASIEAKRAALLPPAASAMKSAGVRMVAAAEVTFPMQGRIEGEWYDGTGVIRDCGGIATLFFTYFHKKTQKFYEQQMSSEDIAPQGPSSANEDASDDDEDVSTTSDDDAEELPKIAVAPRAPPLVPAPDVEPDDFFALVKRRSSSNKTPSPRELLDKWLSGGDHFYVALQSRRTDGVILHDATEPLPTIRRSCCGVIDKDVTNPADVAKIGHTSPAEWCPKAEGMAALFDLNPRVGSALMKRLGGLVHAGHAFADAYVTPCAKFMTAATIAAGILAPGTRAVTFGCGVGFCSKGYQLGGGGDVLGIDDDEGRLDCFLNILKVRGTTHQVNFSTTTGAMRGARLAMEFAGDGPLLVRMTTSCIGFSSCSTHNNDSMFPFEVRSCVFDTPRLICACLAVDLKKQIVGFEIENSPNFLKANDPRSPWGIVTRRLAANNFHVAAWRPAMTEMDGSTTRVRAIVRAWRARGAPKLRYL